MKHGFNDETKEKVDLLDFFYPVGTIYETSNSGFNPNNVWGGTWVQITGKFLLASSGSYAIGTTGGEASINYTPSGTVGGHVLTVNEIPSHNHSIPALSGTAASAGGHSHKYDYPTWFDAAEGSGDLIKVGATGEYAEYDTSSAGAHSHSVTTEASNTGSKGGSGSHNHGFTGRQANINNMPPYEVVNVWKRTA